MLGRSSTEAGRSAGNGLHARLRHGQSGASAVEFSVISIVVFALTFGMFNGALAWNTKQQLTHAVRDAARFGATLPTPCETPGDCDFTPWANEILDRAESASINELDPSIFADRYVCAAYVLADDDDVDDDGSPDSVNFALSRGTPTGPVAPPNDGTHRCYDDGIVGNDEPRVQVVAGRPYQIEILVADPEIFKITLPAAAVARHEGAIE